MKIVSFNINGLRARLHQLSALIEKHQPDVIALQEIKVHDDAFPIEAVEALGYHVYFHGQKAHHGVATMTKQPALAVEKGLPWDEEDAQRRMIITTVADAKGQSVKIFNGYFPQGENREHETKFPAKRRFYADLTRYLDESHSADDNILIVGDINISPIDLDIGIGEKNAQRWLKTGKCSFLPEEREWLAKLLQFGLVDTYRALHPDQSERYSWFDYRSRGFDDNRGLRIDAILATSPMAKRALESDIDYQLRAIEKPSDHAPIWTTFAD
ncbi:exodeoxyribonuclease III [Celerinatantimonas sp. MCCC 1A17872]|uniref:exodeoxyribonuclease III n=1 Tax=Celerinatantimonas sp. MCCC 1A17872 TaxID=3177514 RepID=UPI0038C921AD